MTRLAIAFLLIVPTIVRAAEPVDGEYFEKRIRPILAERCFSCHGSQAKEAKSGLRLDSRASVLKGGERGPAIVPGSPEKSRLIEVISHKNADLQMPPRDKLSDAAIAELTAWVKAGAPWPGGDAAVVERKSGFDLAKRKAEHWCWQPVKATTPPAVKDARWPLSDVDRFILARLEAAGLQPAAPAEKTAWLRRVYFDLVGLPPTVAEIAQFEAACGLAGESAARSQVVDKLLASPHYGERWARHWLDLVRYAETKGHEFDPIIPNAWQYRDYVIRAFNADVPYNQFVTEHIAGDLMTKPRLDPKDGFNESILGTGFWFLGEEVHSPVDIRGDEADRIDNKIDVFSKTFLGLTVSCARCHDHKFDAISQKDYYALSGFLLSSAYRQVRFDSMEENKRIAEELKTLRERYRLPIQRALADTIEPAVSRIWPLLLKVRTAIRAGKPGDSEEVNRWIAHLKEAEKNPLDPFHVFAVLCTLDDAKAMARVAEIAKDRKSKVEQRYEALENAIRIAAVTDRRHDSWHADDQGMNQPVAHDWIRWGVDASKPILGFREMQAIERDAFWKRLAITLGTELEHGALGASNRYGRIVRTSAFSLTSNKVQLLVKGHGRVYAAIDSHTLVAGPLHGKLVRDFNTNQKWDWVTLDLSNYKDHRLHLEVSANDDGEFAVAEAIQGNDAPPPTALFLTDGHDDGLSGLRNIEDFARYMAGTIARVVNGLREVESQEWMQNAPMGNLIIRKPELFGISDFARVADAAKPMFVHQAELERKAHFDSRLAPAMWYVAPVDEQVHIRGSHKSLGEVIPQRFLEALAGPGGLGKENSKVNERLALAQQLTNPAINPLIARVIVNRVWHHLFGRGIVASVDNFGVMGDKPTHPELLDYLADRFVRQGWSVKTLIRELVLSQTYRMSSQADPKAAQVDGENLLLHSARLRRLQGEAIRDAMLAVSGRLDPTMYGKPVPVHLTEFLEGRGRPGASGPLDGNGRRSIYTAVRRNFLPTFMLAFDTPSPFSTMGRRSESNVPAQALILMNDPFVHQQAERWGKHVADSTGDVATKIDRMYVSAFARRPTAGELIRSREFIDRRGATAIAWSDLAHVLFNVKEFIYVP